MDHENHEFTPFTPQLGEGVVSCTSMVLHAEGELPADITMDERIAIVRALRALESEMDARLRAIVNSRGAAESSVAKAPWRGPVRVMVTPYGWFVRDVDDRDVARCWHRGDADAIAAKLNAPDPAPAVGCDGGCRAVATHYADACSDERAAHWLRTLASRLPAPAAVGDAERQINTMAGQITEMSAALAAKDAEIARWQEAVKRLEGIVDASLARAIRDRDAAESARDAAQAECERLRNEHRALCTVLDDARADHERLWAERGGDAGCSRELTNDLRTDLARVTAERDKLRGLVKDAAQVARRIEVLSHAD